jgi:hypothetical protein
MKSTAPIIAAAWLSLAVMPLTPVHAALPGMKIIKLTSRSTGPLAMREFGASVAVSETYAVVGEPAYDLAVPKPGAVHIYNATTGAFMRTLKPLDSIDSDGFGSSVAVQGKFLLVGANRRMSPGQGAAYLFDLATGKQLRKIDAFEHADFFGSSVAISGDLLFVSAPEASNRRGKILVQGLLDPTITGVLKDDNANSFSYMGKSFYAFGNQVVASAPGVGTFYLFNRATPKGTFSLDNVTSNTPIGAAIVGYGQSIFTSLPLNDLTHSDGGTIQRITFGNTTGVVQPVDPAPANNRQLGRLMAMDGATLIASFESGAAGTGLIVNDTRTQSHLLTIAPKDLATNVPHSALALSGNRLLIGCSGDDMLGTDAGVAYLIQNLPQAPGFVTIAAKGDPAPGFADIQHHTLGDAVLSQQGLTVTRSTLSGSGSNGGRDIGIYSEVGHEGYLDSVVKSRQAYFGNSVFGKPGSPIANDPTFSLFPSTLAGIGVSSANNSAFFADNGNTVSTVVRAGLGLFPLPQVTVSKLHQAAQSHSASRVAVRLDLRIAPNVTTALNDSAIALQTHAGINTELVREGADLGMNRTLGQINPRVAFHSNVYLFTGAVTSTVDPTFKRVGLFQKTPAGALTLLTLDQSPIIGAPGFEYGGFLGEGGSSANKCLRVRIKGPGITAANNEMILFDSGNGLETRFQKNSSIIGRILRLWPQGNRLLVHVTLRGPGISGSNNEAIYLSQENGSFSRLLQKGDVLPGTGGARVGKIQRVEGGTNTGHYAVLVSLSGVPATSNQMLLRGNTFEGMPSDEDEFSLRRPVPVLQKGRLIANGYAGNSRITSLTFASNATVDSTGIGGKGLGSVVSTSGAVLLRATFSDGSTRLIRVP